MRNTVHVRSRKAFRNIENTGQISMNRNTEPFAESTPGRVTEKAVMKAITVIITGNR